VKITKADLVNAFIVWATDVRLYPDDYLDTDSSPVVEVAEESANYLWRCLKEMR
jgi:hypothetical protein